MFSSFTICNFGIPKYPSFYIWTFQILTPTHLFDILHYSHFRQFSYMFFDINLFRVSTQFSTFERSLIFRYETSAILKFYYSQFCTLFVHKIFVKNFKMPLVPWFTELWVKLHEDIFSVHRNNHKNLKNFRKFRCEGTLLIAD